MKKVLSIAFTILLSAAFLQPAFAEESEESNFTFALRNHVDLPQPVVNQDSIGIMGIGYHFTLFDWGNRVSLGGLGTGVGAQDVAPDGEDSNWDARFYLQIPAVDLCLSKGGYGTDDDDAVFEFSTGVVYEVRSGDWGIRGLFSVGW
jgi:hypothetical protein